MADVGFLSAVVKSLVRDEEERKEAVGLLLDLSDIQSVRRRLGRIQGCIVMLVALLNGDDLVASRHAGKLLNALSNSTQNALHMAEAGYFKPLVQYLNEGDQKASSHFCNSFRFDDYAVFMFIILTSHWIMSFLELFNSMNLSNRS